MTVTDEAAIDVYRPQNLTATVQVDTDAVFRSLGLNLRDPNVQAAVAVCQRYDLDPVLKHVVVVEGNPFITRDGLLHVAHLSGQLDGIVLEGDVEDLGDEWQAKVSVYRKDMTHPFTFPGRYPKMQKTRNGDRVHPYGQEMAVKCAESHALRRAFSVSGMGIADEIHTGTTQVDGLPAAPGVEPSFGGGGPAAATPTLDWDALRSALGAKVARLNRNHHECWEAWKADHDGWFNDLSLLGEADAEVVRMLQAQGVDPFLDEIVEAEIVTDGDQLGESDGRAGDAGQVDGEGSSRTPVESLPAPPVLTTDGGGGTQEGVAREVEAGASDPAPDLAPQGDGAGSPIAKARASVDAAKQARDEADA